MTHTLTPAAHHALRAATMRKSIGNHAARRMAQRTCGMALYRLACQLLAAHRGGVTA